MPANYEQPKDVVKRTRFFDGQFLKDQDFIDDQKYHIDRQRRPNRLLRVSGICEGLTVEVKDTRVIVTAGTALDRQGRLIVLSDSFAVDLQNQTGEVDIFISYGNEESDITQPANDRTDSATATTDGNAASNTKGAKGATRWWENPQIETVKDRSALKGDDSIWLGRVTVEGSGGVTLTSIGDREYSGIYLPSSAEPFEGPMLRSGGDLHPKLAILTGDLSIQGTTADNTAAGFNVTNKNNISLLCIRNDGNVGIGANYPQDKLEVAGNLRILTDSNPIRFTSSWSQFPDDAFNQAEISNDTETFKTLMIVGNSSGGGGRKVSVWDRLEVNGHLTTTDNVGIGTTDPTIHLAIGDNDTGFQQQGDGQLAIYTNSIEKCRITNTGNVGIGTTTPGAKLAINGGLHVGGDSDPGDNNLLVDGVIKGNKLELIEIAAGEVMAWGSVEAESYVGLTIGFPDKAFGGKLKIGAWNTDKNRSLQEFMRINASGNVGIGTTTPSEKLEVNGNIKTNGNLRVLGAKTFSLVGTAKHNQQVSVPSLNTDSWNIFLSPKYIGYDESSSLSNIDNTLLKFEIDFTADTQKQYWTIKARYLYKFLNNYQGDWQDGEVHYLIVPK